MEDVRILKIYPLSPLQEGMLFHSLLDGESEAYFEQVSVEVTGAVELQIFRESFNVLVQRHEVLRTIFLYEEVEKPRQIVLAKMEGEVNYEDISALSPDEQQRWLATYQAKDRQRGFVLTEEILMRVALVQTGIQKYTVIWSFHHIIMDGWCIGILLQEFNRIYAGLRLGQAPQLERTVPYSEYIRWLQKQDEVKAAAYWERYLAGYEEEAGMGKLARQQETGAYCQEEVLLELNAELTERVRSLAVQNQVTINTLLQVVWGIVLQKYNNTYDVVFGSVVSGRSANIRGIEQMVGLFINTVPVRISRGRDTSFGELLKAVQEQSLESAHYDYFPLSRVQAMSAVKQRLIDHIMVFENFPIGKGIAEAGEQGDLPFHMQNASFFEQTNYDFNLVVIPGDTLLIKFQFNVNAYERKLVEQIRSHMLKVLETVLVSSQIAVKDISLLLADEAGVLLRAFNAKKMDYPADKTIHQLFIEQAHRTPEQIAVTCDGQQITYCELNERSNQLARRLKESGIGANQPVGIYLERSLEMIVGLLAILKAGGAYLPVDPEYPVERISYMLTNSGAGVVLTQQSLQGNLPEEVTALDITASENYQGDHSDLGNPGSGGDLAYIMYTSGSTGKPKGVMIEHRQVNNCIFWMQDEFQLGPDAVIVQRTNLTFDPSVWEIFWPLYLGGQVRVLTGEQNKNIEFLVQLLSGSTDLTMMYCPASLVTGMAYLLNSRPLQAKLNLPWLIIGAEPISMNVIRSFYQHFAGRIVNTYGPTECTINNTYFELHRDDQRSVVPIGRPVANNQIYILDKDMQPLPVPAAGELYIAGDSVGRGYINNPEKTAEVFIANPFGPGKLYKTGDRGRWTEDGIIEILGRADNQVKIRGFRIEPGEIESQLQLHPDVKEAVVMCREDSNHNKYLCAYVVGDRSLRESDLREYLGKNLPEYMIPAQIMQLEALPLTSNGKVDRKNLPEPDGRPATEYTAPSTEAEAVLAAVWAEVLGREQVGVTDNFFELGGDSIKAIQILTKATQQMINITVKDIFKYKTIAGILANADYTRSLKQISQSEVQGEVALTPIQRWFFDQKLAYPEYWNQSLLFAVPDDVNAALLERVLQKTCGHHDALRMSYRLGADGQVIQYNRGEQEVTVTVEQVDLSQLAAYEQRAAIRRHCEEVQRSLNLTDDLLLKARIFDLGENGKRLFLGIHHLVIDAVSWRILLEDIELLYQSKLSESLPPKTTSFKEWSERLLEYAETMSVNVQYWEAISQNRQPAPVQVEERYLARYRRNMVEVSGELTGQLLTQVNQAYNTEINDILLSAFVLAYTETFRTDAVLLNLEGHGREELMENTDLSRTIGWFTCMYPVYFEHKRELSDTIIHVKESLRKIPNKGLDYGIGRYLLNNDKLGQLKPEITFNYLGQFAETASADSAGLLRSCSEEPGMSAHPENQHLTLFDLTETVQDGKLQIVLHYHPEVYPQERAEAFLSAYVQALEEVVEHCLHKEDRFFTESDLEDEGILQDDLAILAREFSI